MCDSLDKFFSAKIRIFSQKRTKVKAKKQKDGRNRLRFEIMSYICNRKLKIKWK